MTQSLRRGFLLSLNNEKVVSLETVAENRTRHRGLWRVWKKHLRAGNLKNSISSFFLPATKHLIFHLFTTFPTLEGNETSWRVFVANDTIVSVTSLSHSITDCRTRWPKHYLVNAHMHRAVSLIVQNTTDNYFPNKRNEQIIFFLHSTIFPLHPSTALLNILSQKPLYCCNDKIYHE